MTIIDHNEATLIFKFGRTCNPSNGLMFSWGIFLCVTCHIWIPVFRNELHIMKRLWVADAITNFLFDCMPLNNINRKITLNWNLSACVYVFISGCLCVCMMRFTWIKMYLTRIKFNGSMMMLMLNQSERVNNKLAEDACCCPFSTARTPLTYLQTFLCSFHWLWSFLAVPIFFPPFFFNIRNF